MSNTSIVTDRAKSLTRDAVNAYGAEVFAHINGDFAQHTSVTVYSDGYVDSSGHQGIDLETGLKTTQLRLLASEDVSGVSTDYAVVVPIIQTGTQSSLTGQPPLIIRQPTNVSAIRRSTAKMSVYAISDTPLSYQWQKSAMSAEVYSSLPSQSASSIVLTNTQPTNTGKYRCVVMNSNGTTISHSGTITVDPARIVNKPEDESGGFFGNIF